MFQPKLICFTVAGVFKELSTTSEEATPEVRFFQRQFIVVPAGNGFCIRNEMIFIANPTQIQLRTAFKPAAVQAASVVAPAAASVGIPVAGPIQPVVSLLVLSSIYLLTQFFSTAIHVTSNDCCQYTSWSPSG